MKLLIGLIIGGIIGYATCCLMVIAGEEEDDEE